MLFQTFFFLILLAFLMERLCPDGLFQNSFPFCSFLCPVYAVFLLSLWAEDFIFSMEFTSVGGDHKQSEAS